MRRKLIFGLLVVPLGLVLIALAVANRAAVSLILDPFGASAGSLVVEAPLFLFLLGAFGLGLAIGGFATWLSQAKWRRSAREAFREQVEWRRRADRLEKELEATHLAPSRTRLPAD